MKRFRFRLEQVLRVRRIQEDIARGALHAREPRGARRGRSGQRPHRGVRGCVAPERRADATKRSTGCSPGSTTRPARSRWRAPCISRPSTSSRNAAPSGPPRSNASPPWNGSKRAAATNTRSSFGAPKTDWSTISSSPATQEEPTHDRHLSRLDRNDRRLSRPARRAGSRARGFGLRRVAGRRAPDHPTAGGPGPEAGRRRARQEQCARQEQRQHRSGSTGRRNPAGRRRRSAQGADREGRPGRRPLRAPGGARGAGVDTRRLGRHRDARLEDRTGARRRRRQDRYRDHGDRARHYRRDRGRRGRVARPHRESGPDQAHRPHGRDVAPGQRGPPRQASALAPAAAEPHRHHHAGRLAAAGPEPGSGSHAARGDPRSQSPGAARHRAVRTAARRPRRAPWPSVSTWTRAPPPPRRSHPRPRNSSCRCSRRCVRHRTARTRCGSS